MSTMRISRPSARGAFDASGEPHLGAPAFDRIKVGADEGLGGAGDPPRNVIQIVPGRHWQAGITGDFPSSIIHLDDQRGLPANRQMTPPCSRVPM